MKHFVVIFILVIASTFLVHTGLISAHLLPAQASLQALTVDEVFGIHMWLISFLFSLIMIILVYSLIFFHRRKGETGDGAYITGNSTLEITWTAIPLVLVIALAIIGAQTLGVVQQIDPSAMVVKVVAGQWFWNFQYPDYGIASKELWLPFGKQIDLQMTSNDVIHSFWVPQFRIKQDIVPGRTTDLRITPTLIGDYTVYCNQLCGLRHAYMQSPVKVVSQADFDKWVSQQQANAPKDPALAGQLSAQNYGCANCHTTDGTKSTGPTWLHLYGSNVKLSDGSTVVADDTYIKNSIINPNLQIVAGFQSNVMPDFSKVLDQTMVDDLIAYLKTLK
jgi:cytochrome c oxidase subunit II